MRAIAVIAVLLNHAKFNHAVGGYVGVDIFFVISGFLLTFITLGDIEENRFSLWHFYERRIRRIIPALLVVCSITTAAAFLLLSPDSVRNYLGSLLATLLFGANFYFYFGTDYFAPSSDLELLLHTWSLGVEEQFYLFFPALFVFFYVRKKAVLVASIVLIASLSLALSAGDHLAVFYLLPYRAWEFAVGALIALFQHKNGQSPARIRFAEIAVLSGIALMVGAASVTPEGASVFYLIPPVLGAAAVILFGYSSRVSRLVLANPLMTYIGSISYSLYLWHQPIFAIARERSIAELDFTNYLPLIGLTFLLSHLSYRLVEIPFRNRKKVSLRRLPIFLSCLALPTLILAPILNMGITRTGLIVDGDLLKYVNYSAVSDRSETWSAMDRYKATDLPIKVAVVGNSHARDMWNALRLSSISETVEFIPLITNRQCQLSRKDRYLSLVLPVRAAVIAAADCETKYPFLQRYLDSVAGVIIAPLWHQIQVDDLPKVLAAINIRDVPVLVVGNTARFNDVPQTIRNLALAGTSDIQAINREVGRTRWDESEINNQVQQIAQQHGAVFLDRGSLVCPPSGCDLTFDYGHLTLFDSGHWTLDGARRFASRIHQNPSMQEFMVRVRGYDRR